jgi:hypothetical protein
MHEKQGYGTGRPAPAYPAAARITKGRPNQKEKGERGRSAPTWI